MLLPVPADPAVVGATRPASAPSEAPAKKRRRTLPLPLPIAPAEPMSSKPSAEELRAAAAAAPATTMDDKGPAPADTRRAAEPAGAPGGFLAIPECLDLNAANSKRHRLATEGQDRRCCSTAMSRGAALFLAGIPTAVTAAAAGGLLPGGAGPAASGWGLVKRESKGWETVAFLQASGYRSEPVGNVASRTSCVGRYLALWPPATGERTLRNFSHAFSQGRGMSHLVMVPPSFSFAVESTEAQVIVPCFPKHHGCFACAGGRRQLLGQNFQLAAEVVAALAKAGIARVPETKVKPWLGKIQVGADATIQIAESLACSLAVLQDRRAGPLQSRHQGS